MTWQVFFTIISSIGFGTIISSWIATDFQKKKLTFEIKLTKYNDLIQAYQNQYVDHGQTGRQHLVSQLKQVELISTDEISKLCQKIEENSNNREIRDELVKAMSEDLKKYQSSTLSRLFAVLKCNCNL